jgi:hypothetical protein
MVDGRWPVFSTMAVDLGYKMNYRQRIDQQEDQVEVRPCWRSTHELSG